MSRTRVAILAGGVVLLALQLAGAWQAVLGAYLGEVRARLPFEPVGSAWRAEDLEIEAREAGIAAGDRIVSVGGRPFTGTRQLALAVRETGPGGILEVEVASGGQPARSVRVTLRKSLDRLGRAQSLVMAGLQGAVVPLVALGLGLWTVFVRPRDPRAWLVFAVLASMNQMVRIETALWPSGLAEAGAFLLTLGRRTWPAWLFLLAVWFPERLPVERRHGWAKWLLAGPVLVVAPLQALLAAGRIEHAGSMGGVATVLAAIPLHGVFPMVCVAGFFFLMGWKAGVLKDNDSRRRVRLLMFGGQAALTPLFVVILILLFSGRDAESIPMWFLVPAFLAVSIFPLTLAYAIVVDRAMDVRVTLRLGIRYLIAKNGLRLAIFAILLPLGLGVAWFRIRSDAPEWTKLAAIAAFLALCVLVARRARRVMQAIDKRFFQDQYDEEVLLTELSDQVRTIVDPAELFDTISERIDRALHATRVAVLLREGDVFRAARARGVDPEIVPPLPAAGAVAGHLARSGAPAVVTGLDSIEWARGAGPLPEEEKAVLRAIEASLLLPLSARGRLQGILVLGPKRSEQPYSATDRRLLRTVAVQAGLALENSRLAAEMAAEIARREKLHREIEIAREVQETLFPRRLPQVEGADVAGVCRPASGVGGDYFDYFAFPDGSLAFALGDVSGKGIPAALLMASLQASLRSQAMRGASDLASLMADVNRLLCDASPENRYATFFLARWDPRTGALDWVNAGHNPPVVLRGRAAEREAVWLERTGTVVGLLPDAAYTCRRVPLASGDVVVAYSDGISEAWNHAEEDWGDERLVAAIRAADGESAATIVERVLRDADLFTAGAPQHDDMTLVVLRVR